MSREIEELKEQLADVTLRFDLLKDGIGDLVDSITRIEYTVYDKSHLDFLNSNNYSNPKYTEEYISKVSKIQNLENELKNLKIIMSSGDGDDIKNTVLLRDAVERSGIITRTQVQKLLGGCHHNVALKIMKEAASMFNLILTKNKKGRWVLAAQ